MKLVVLSALLSFVPIPVDVQTSADLILINANIRTMDSSGPRAEALAARDGRIVAIGSTRDIRKLANDKTQVIDAGGKLVLPGFNDAHVHFTGIGNQFSHLDLRKARETSEVLDRIAFYASVLPKGRWLLGGGLSLQPKDIPTLAQLDQASPNNPVLIYLSGNKSSLVNSAAAMRSRLAINNAVVAGESVARVRHQVPADHERNWPEIAETASNYAASLGVTSVHDVHSDDLIDILNDLATGGRLKTRVYDCVGIQHRRRSITAGLRAATGNAFVRGGCVKGLAEGTTDEIDELRTSIMESDKGGLQVMIHAIGARSNTNVLAAFEAVAARGGRRDRRFRIEHATRMRPSDVSRLARSSIIASMQPHLFGAGSDDYRAIVDSGATLAFGSDASITDFNPLLGIHAAVNGNSRSTTVEEAVRAYTLGSAYSEFQEKEKGTLKVGKLADCVILSDDIFTINSTKIGSVKVLVTIVNGHIVFESKQRAK